jgi:hypothetical protein
VLTGEKLDSIGAQLEHSPLEQPTQEIEMLKRTMKTTTDFFKPQPYKVVGLLFLHSCDSVTRFYFCIFFRWQEYLKIEVCQTNFCTVF